MIKWIKYLDYKQHIRYINIIDDNFTYNVDFAKSVCRKLIKMNLKNLRFGTPNGIRFQRSDAELFKLMKQAGWEFIIVAPESGSEKTLEKMGKHLNLADLPGKVKEIKEAGLKCIGFFMVGYPGETKNDIKKTVQLIRRTPFDFFVIHFIKFSILSSAERTAFVSLYQASICWSFAPSDLVSTSHSSSSWIDQIIGSISL